MRLRQPLFGKFHGGADDRSRGAGGLGNVFEPGRGFGERLRQVFAFLEVFRGFAKVIGDRLHRAEHFANVFLFILAEKDVAVRVTHKAPPGCD
jgi:hypothetical protein